jgi:hypothetical protein
MLHPSTNHGSVGAAGLAGGKGKPVWPNVSPEKVTWMVSFVLVLWVKPGLQEVFKALPEAGEHPGSKPALTFVVLLPPQAHASASEMAKDFFMMNSPNRMRRARRREGWQGTSLRLTLQLRQESGGDAFGARR